MKTRRIRPVYFTLLIVFSLTVAWQLGAGTSTFVTSPASAIATTPLIWGDYAHNLGYTLVEYTIALVLSVGIGVPTGILIGWNRILYRIANPLLGLAMVTPKIAFWPTIIIWLGVLSNNSIIAIGALLAVFPIIINSMAGVQVVNREHVILGKSIGMSPIQIFYKIILPSAYPSIFIGLFLGSNLAMTGVLLVEMLVNNEVGIGYLILHYSNLFLTSDLYAASVLTLLITLSISGCLWYLSRYFETRNML